MAAMSPCRALPVGQHVLGRHRLAGRNALGSPTGFGKIEAPAADGEHRPPVTKAPRSMLCGCWRASLSVNTGAKQASVPSSSRSTAAAALREDPLQLLPHRRPACPVVLGITEVFAQTRSSRTAARRTAARWRPPTCISVAGGVDRVVGCAAVEHVGAAALGMDAAQPCASAVLINENDAVTDGRVDDLAPTGTRAPRATQRGFPSPGRGCRRRSRRPDSVAGRAGLRRPDGSQRAREWRCS